MCELTPFKFYSWPNCSDLCSKSLLCQFSFIFNPVDLLLCSQIILFAHLKTAHLIMNSLVKHLSLLFFDFFCQLNWFFLTLASGSGVIDLRLNHVLLVFEYLFCNVQLVSNITVVPLFFLNFFFLSKTIGLTCSCFPPISIFFNLS